MAYGSEAKATLGVDTSHVPEDMAKARAAFNKGAEDIAKDAGKHGANAGEQFVHGIEHKILGARHLSGALVAALALDVHSISEKITAAIVGGTAEGWKESLELSKENARLIGAIIEARLTPKGREEFHQKELDKAIRESNPTEEKGSLARSAAVTILGGPLKQGQEFADRFLAVLGWGKTAAEKLKETEEKTNAVLEAQAKTEEDKRKTREDLKALDDQALDAAEKQGTLQERNDKILDHVQKLQEEIAKGGLTEVEVARKKVEIENKFTEVQNIQKQIREKAITDEKRLLDIESKRADLGRQRIELTKDEAKITDRGKLTVGELAAIATNKKTGAEQQAAEDEARRGQAFQFGRNDGLSSDQVKARDTAEQIQRLEREADRARLAGDTGKATGLLDQVGGLRDTLVKGGFTKTTEGDPATLLREQIAKDNDVIKKTLGEIKTIEAGKYVNQ